MKTLKKFENFVNERKTTSEEIEILSYLNDLRQSGVVNMFGATSYIIDEFGIDKREASRILSLWMKNFNDEGDYENVNEKYTEGDKKKDYRRIEDIVEKGEIAASKKGTLADDEMIKLAITQANRIKNAEKSYQRGLAAEDGNWHDVAEIFFKRSEELKKQNESYDDDEVGGINLKVNGARPTTWYFLSDAIMNGLLEETLDLNDEIIEQYGENNGIDYLTMEDLTDMLIEDFETELGNLLSFLIEIDYLSQDISSVSIEGEDDDGEYHEYDFFLD